MASDRDIDIIRSALVERMLSGELFTFAEMCSWCVKTFGPGDYYRLADRTIQSLRGKGKIAYVRDGRNTIWRSTGQIRPADTTTPAEALAFLFDVYIEKLKLTSPEGKPFDSSWGVVKVRADLYAAMTEAERARVVKAWITLRDGMKAPGK